MDVKVGEVIKHKKHPLHIDCQAHQCSDTCPYHNMRDMGSVITNLYLCLIYIFYSNVSVQKEIKAKVTLKKKK